MIRPGGSSRPSTAIATVDLPEPDSPTIAEPLTRADRQRQPVHGPYGSLPEREVDDEVVDREDDVARALEGRARPGAVHERLAHEA